MDIWIQTLVDLAVLMEVLVFKTNKQTCYNNLKYKKVKKWQKNTHLI